MISKHFKRREAFLLRILLFALKLSFVLNYSLGLDTYDINLRGYTSCPNFESSFSLKSCECFFKANETVLRCKNLKKEDVITDLEKLSGMSYQTLHLDNCSVHVFTEELLINKRLRKLVLRLNKLTNITTQASQAMGNALTELVIDETLFRSSTPLFTLSDLGLVNMGSLEVLDIITPYINKIKNFTFRNQSRLKRLHLKSRVLNHVDPNAFYGLRNLQELLLDSHDNVNIQRSHLIHLETLESLRISVARLDMPENLFQGGVTPRLKQLDISLSGVRELPEGLFGPLTNSLVNFTATFNSLKIMPTIALPKLRTLNLEFNNFQNLTGALMRRYPSLVHLDLFMNAITHVSEDAFEQNPNLEFVDLTGNDITSLPNKTFAGLTRLKTISLSQNRLKGIPDDLFAFNAQLKGVQLARSGINDLNPKTFAKSVRTLRRIDLSQNNIRSIRPGTFRDMDRLEILDLRKNAITQLDPDEFRESEQTMKSIKLTDNPFACNCNLSKFLTWYDTWVDNLDPEDSEIQKALMENVKCASGLLGSLQSIDRNQLCLMSNVTHPSVVATKNPDFTNESREPFFTSRSEIFGKIKGSLTLANSTNLDETLHHELYLIKRLTVISIALSMFCLLSLVICLICQYRKFLLFSNNHLSNYKFMDSSELKDRPIDGVTQMANVAKRLATRINFHTINSKRGTQDEEPIVSHGLGLNNHNTFNA